MDEIATERAATHEDSESPAGEHERHVVLVHPEIPWNTGNAGRTCLALGAQLHLIRPLGFRIDERSVRRAGLDYWQHVAPRIWSRWTDFEEVLPQLGEPYFFSAEGERGVWDVEFPRRSVLIFGRETQGLPREIREKYAEHLVSVPMADGPVRSLNLSTTVGIALAAASRPAGKGADYSPA